MKFRLFTVYAVFLISMICSSGGYCEDVDSLTLSREIHLNERQPPDTVLKTIGIKPGMVIGEVGAGRGRYTVQMAARLDTTGMIYANDIDSVALQFLEKRCVEHGFANVKTILSDVTDSKLPDSALDMVIMVNVVHCLAKPVELLENIGNSLKPDAPIVIVEGDLDKDTTNKCGWYSRSKMIKIFQDAGYDLAREENFLPLDNIYFFKKPAQPEK